MFVLMNRLPHSAIIFRKVPNVDLFYCHVSAFGSDTPITAMNRSELARLIKTTREIHIPVEIMKGEYSVEQI